MDPNTREILQCPKRYPLQNKPTNHQTNKPTKQQTNKPTNQQTNKPTNQRTIEPTNRSETSASSVRIPNQLLTRNLETLDVTRNGRTRPVPFVCIDSCLRMHGACCRCVIMGWCHLLICKLRCCMCDGFGFGFGFGLWMTYYMAILCRHFYFAQTFVGLNELNTYILGNKVLYIYMYMNIRMYVLILKSTNMDTNEFANMHAYIHTYVHTFVILIF